MTVLRGRVCRLTGLLLPDRRLGTGILATAILLSACGVTLPSPSSSSASAAPSPPPSTAPTPSVASRTAAPTVTPVPGAPSPSPAMILPLTTDTQFGRVWDGLPPSWPTLPGQSQSEVGTDASAHLVIRGDPLGLARLLRDALVVRGWRVDVGSVLENGSVVVDATRAPTGCKARAEFTPNNPGSNDGGVLIYYGAACPFA